MKLIRFDSTNSRYHQTGTATIYLSATQCSSIPKITQKEMGLKPGDGISLFQDEENPNDWYLCKDKSGFPLRLRKCGALVFSSTYAVNKLFDSIDYRLKHFRFPVSKKGIKHGDMTLFAIITSAAQKSDT